MVQRQTILQNIGWLAVGNLAVKPAWFLFLLLSTRYLGPVEFGKYMYAISFVAIIGVILEGGVDLLIVREVAARPHEFAIIAAHSIALKVILAFLSIGVAYAAALAVHPSPDTVNVIMLAAVYSSCNSLMLHFRSVFRAFEVMKYEAHSIIAEKLLVIVCCGAALLINLHAETFTLGYAVAYTLAAAATFWSLKKHFGGIQFRIDPAYLWKNILRPALPFALMNIFVILYFRSGTIILRGVTHSEESVGYFNSGYRLIESYMMFPTILVAPLYPVFSRRGTETSYLQKIARDSLRTIWAVSALVSIPIAVFHREVTLLLYGDGYLGGATSVGILGLATIPIGMTFLTGIIIAATGKQGKSNLFIFMVTVLNVALNFVMIHRLGVTGAALTTLITEVVLATLNCWLVKEYLPPGEVGRLLLKLGVPFVTLAVLKTAGFLPQSTLLRLALGVGIVTAFFYASGMVRLDDAKKIMGRR